MNGVREEFLKRASDAIAYVRHLDGQEKIKSGGPKEHTLQTLRGAAYLVIYNMVEATAREGFSAIFEHLEKNQVSFDEASKPLRHFVLKNAKHPNPAKLEEKLNAIAIDVFSAVFDPARLFSGNVDSKRLGEVAKGFGYEHRPGRGGEELLRIKDRRNDLAHGLKSFSKIGREVLASDLKRDLVVTILYLRRFLTEIDKFLASQNYLASVPKRLDVVNQGAPNL